MMLNLELEVSKSAGVAIRDQSEPRSGDCDDDEEDDCHVIEREVLLCIVIEMEFLLIFRVEII